MAQTLLKISCPDQVGLLARLTQFIACHGGNLLEVHQFTDPLNQWFFARLAIDSDTLPLNLASLRTEFEPIAESIEARWLLHDASQRSRVVILASKADHCLADLLGRWRTGELPIDIAAVISNHDLLRPLVEREGVRFEHVPVAPENKEAAFEAMHAMFTDLHADLIVLARYMQIIPPTLCEKWKNRIINIHHSFLPSFAGANPYRRAYERGVKLIGATCHYATPDLDEGPIIDQEVIRVEHFHTPDDLLRMGRDCERLALARGVRYHVGERVLVHKGRSIVFRD